MSKFAAALFDADGVVVQAPDYFSRIYASKHGLDVHDLEKFFDDKFRATSVGKGDLKELIAARRDVWRFEGNPGDLVAEWLAAEDCPNAELVVLIQKLRQQGVVVGLASVQEKYRAAYMRDVMFPNMFDDYFFSCELGVAKGDPKFFQKVIDALRVQPEKIAYFDDSQSALDVAATLGIATYLYADV